MTLPGMLVSLVVGCIALAGFVLVERAVRHQAAVEHTRQTLRQLNRALALHARNHGHAPTGDAHDALRALQHASADHATLDALPLQRHTDRWRVTDGFGRPMRYRPPDQTPADHGAFVSAGPDGRFGDPYASQSHAQRAAADNILGHDLAPANTQPEPDTL